MAEKIIDSRIQLKTDTTEKWEAVKVTFTPKKGESIFYSDVQKFKVGDGSNVVKDFPFLGASYETIQVSDSLMGG